MTRLLQVVLPAVALTCSCGCSALFGSDFEGYEAAAVPSHDGGPDGNRGGGDASGNGSDAGGAPGTEHDGAASGGFLDSGGSAGGAAGTSDRLDGGVSSATEAGLDGAGGSGGASPEGSTTSKEAGVDDVALGPIGQMWVENRLAPTKVPVCFTTGPHREIDQSLRCDGQRPGSACSGDTFTGTSEDLLRRAFATLVQDSWSRAAAIEFTGFGDCAAADDGVLESGAAAAMMVVSFVTRSVDREPLTRLTSGYGKHDAFSTDLHVDWMGLRDRDPDAIRVILREVGRGLGLPYEFAHNADLSQNVCPPTLIPDPVYQTIGWWPPPDDWSVMDRCNQSHHTPSLSPADALSAASLYGAFWRGSLVGFRGQCATVPGGDATSGTVVTVGSCARGSYNTWSRNPASPPRFEAIFSGAVRCFAVQGGSVSPTGPTPVVSAECDGSESQIITMNDVEWRTNGNMCLTAQFGRMEAAHCDGSPEQRWNFWDADPATPLGFRQIQSVATNDCVSTQSDDGANAEELVLLPCSASARQQFTEDIGHGYIQYKAPYCMNVLEGRVDMGSKTLGIYGVCNPTEYWYDSFFYVSGRLKLMGQCLSVRDDAGGEGREMVVEPCDEAKPAQVWDFHI